MKRYCPTPTDQPSPKRRRTPLGNDSASAGEKTRRDFPHPVKELRESLRTVYKGCTVELNQGKGYDEESLNLDEVYAKLHVVPTKDLSSNVRAADQLGSTAGIEKLSHAFGAAAKKLRPIPLGKIFHVRRSMRRKMHNKSVLALALSCAGGGKTMLFTKKAPYEWAKKRIWRGIDLLFAVELRSAKVRQAETPMQLLDIASYGFEDDECRVINEYIRHHPQRVCIVLDGLDETKLSDCSKFVKNLIAGKRLPGIRLLLTSRHSAEVMKLAQSTPFHRRVEVLGFQKEEVERYVRNVLTADDADEFLAKLNVNPQLAAIMQTPFFAVATCKLYRSGVALPDTLGKIFSALILNVIEQQQKETEEFQEYSDWSSVPDDIKESVLELGFFAFQMLIRKKIIFTEADLDEFEVATPARSLGLLVACDKETGKTTAQWRFSHLAVQESLAARHVASCNLNASDTAWLVEHLGAFTGHLSTFWLLMAAELESKGADALINAILNPQSPSPQAASGHCVTGAEGHRVTYFLCASRGDITQWSEQISEILSRDQVERLAIQLLSDHVGLGWPSLAVEAHLRPGEVERTVDFVQALLLRWRRLVPRANTQLLFDAIDSFAPGYAVRCFTHVPSSTTAHVQYEQSSSEPLLPLSESSPEERRQRLLSACRCFSEHVNSEHSSGAIHSLEPVVKKYGLDFHEVPLTSTDCHALNSVLLHHRRSITIISLGGCGIGDVGYDLLTAGLDLCRNLTALNLEDNSLSDRHALHIGAVITSNRSTLQYLYTSLNTFTSVGNAHIHQYTHLCTNLRVLGIGVQGSTDAPMNLVTVTRILDNCPHLQGVGLNHYLIGGDSLHVAQLQPLLMPLRLQVLALRRAGLTEECAPVMNVILQQQQDSLQFLDLTGNELTDSFFQDVHNTLRHCTRLEEVWLHDAKLTSASLPVLASVLPSWPRLWTLRLARNDFRDSGAEADPFVRAIEECASLQLLVMPESKLVDQQLRDALVRVAGRSANLKVKFVSFSYYDEVKDEEENEGDGEVEVEVVGESESESECEEESESECESDE